MEALVFGGSGSTGSAIVDRLLKDRYEVILQYYQSDISSLEKEYKDEAVEFIQMDLAYDIDFNDMFSHIKHLGCLIYSSGTSLYGMLQDMRDKEIDECYHIHVKQLIRCCRYFMDILRKSANGKIIVISSIWGETGAGMETIYSAMKSAQIGSVKALSQELALTNVTVNVIVPGFVPGRMAKTFSDEDKAVILSELPQQRMTALQEVAHVCAYLRHPNTKNITGTVQKVNGGWYI